MAEKQLRNVGIKAARQEAAQETPADGILKISIELEIYAGPQHSGYEARSVGVGKLSMEETSALWRLWRGLNTRNVRLNDGITVVSSGADLIRYILQQAFVAMAAQGGSRELPEK